MFMLISLKNMNKIINHRWFRMYPEMGLMPEALVPSLVAGIVILFDCPCLM